MIKKLYATLFSFLIFFMTISPSLKLMLEESVKIVVEINIEEESKEKEPKILEFNIDNGLSSNLAVFEFKKNRLNSLNVKHYNSHHIELHSPPPELS